MRILHKPIILYTHNRLLFKQQGQNKISSALGLGSKRELCHYHLVM